MQPRRSVHVSDSVEAFERHAAEEIARAVQESITDRGACSLVLSGGETPRGVYRLLGSHLLKKEIDWPRVHLFFTDERCVPPDDVQSNYGMVLKELAAHVPLPDTNMHRMRGEGEPAKAADEYDEELRKAFPAGEPHFDVILLGVGGDGHTASLFPSTAVLKDQLRWASAVFVPRLNRWRVTLTLRAINTGRAIFILAAGQSKASVVERALFATTPAEELPITMVRPSQGTIHWLLDREAAVNLPPLDQ